MPGGFARVGLVDWLSCLAWSSVSHSCEHGSLHIGEYGQADIPLDPRPAGVLGLQGPEPFDLNHLGAGKSADGALSHWRAKMAEQSADVPTV